MIVLGALSLHVIGRMSDWEIDVVYGGSMEPAIPVGSLVGISPVHTETVQAGDVILFAPPTDTNVRVTHRVIEVVERQNGDVMFLTKGDANEHSDSYGVPADNVIGKVSFCVPYLGYFTDFAQSKMGFLVFLVLPATVLVANELVRLFTYSPRKERRTKVLARRQRQRRLPGLSGVRIID